MKKVERVSNKIHFTNVMNGTKIKNKYFTVFYLSNTITHARFGVAVGKKNVRRAVDRNYYKRQLRSIIDVIINDVIKNDYIVLLTKEGCSLTFQEKDLKLRELFFQNNLMEVQDGISGKK